MDIITNDQNPSKYTPDLTNINYLSKETAQFYDNGGQLCGLKYNGEDYKTINVYRAFPQSLKDEYIIIRHGSGFDEKEIGIIKKLNDFDDETVKLLNKQLELRYFVPRIIKINSVKEKCAFYYFDTLTDAGPKTFAMFYLFRNIKKLADGTICLIDADENRYIIDKTNKISKKYLRYVKNFI